MAQDNTGDTDITARKDIMKIESVPDSLPALEGKLDASGKRFAIVVS
jgi:hypothetical protein